MQTPEPVHAEAARYATSLLFLPGLWAGPELWRGVAGYLAHRGWEGGLVDLRTTAGGLEGRAQAVADYAAGLPAPPVLVGHDAGGLVALAAARRGMSAAVVLVAPRGPAGAARRAIALGIAPLLALLPAGPVPPPEGRMAGRMLGDLPAAARGRSAPTTRPRFAMSPGNRPSRPRSRSRRSSSSGIATRSCRPPRLACSRRPWAPSNAW